MQNLYRFGLCKTVINTSIKATLLTLVKFLLQSMSLLTINDDVLYMIVKTIVKDDQLESCPSDIQELLTLMGVCRSLRSFVIQSPRLWRSLINFPHTMDQVGTMRLFKNLPAFASTVREIHFGGTVSYDVWWEIVSQILGHCKSLEILNITGSGIPMGLVLFDLENFSRSNPGKLKLKRFTFLDIVHDNPGLIPNLIRGVQRTLDAMSSSKVRLDPYSNCNTCTYEWTRRLTCGECSADLATPCSWCKCVDKTIPEYAWYCSICFKDLCHDCIADSCDRCIQPTICKSCDEVETCYECKNRVCDNCGPTKSCDNCEKNSLRRVWIERLGYM